MTKRLSNALMASARPFRTGAATFSVGLLLLVGAARAEGQNISIDNFTFTPAVLIVMPGTTVTWSNADDIPHTIVAAGKAFKSTPLDTNDQFSFTFSTPGDYAYFCSLHPHMTGKIVVRAH